MKSDGVGYSFGMFRKSDIHRNVSGPQGPGTEVFIAMAKFERSLSNNDLNYSMMQKIFLAQTLNLGWDAVIDRL